MFRFFRKHRWLLIVVFTITCGTFLYWGASVPSRNSRGGDASGNFGMIYGKKITPEMYAGANNDIRLLYLFRYGQWPERMSNLSKYELESQIYGRILMRQKAAQLGIYIADSDVATAADQMLRSPELAQALGVKGKNIQFTDFLRSVLEPAGMSADDFQRFVRDDLTVHQLVQSLGLAGSLVTPQEAAALYRREHQPVSAQAVFFSLSNYLSQTAVTPAALAQFYTNHLAEYRLPDRVQVSYVVFEVTNLLAATEQKLNKTNLNAQVENIFRQNGMDIIPGAKTPEEAKAGIRQALIKRVATAEAMTNANTFASALFAMDPPKAENLSALAKQKGLPVKTTAPFGSQFGPEEFLASPAFTRAAFEMSSDVPLAGPIEGAAGYYVIALDKQLPSEIPAFNQIQNRVTEDFQREQARALALKAGTNFIFKLQVALAGGNTFSAACNADGVSPKTLPPFSLSTQELPDLDRDLLNQIKETAFSTPTGRASGLMETADGGFVLYVESRLPVDATQMNADMPQFIANIRHEREQEAFNLWLQTEASRELRNTALASEMPGRQ